MSLSHSLTTDSFSHSCNGTKQANVKSTYSHQMHLSCATAGPLRQNNLQCHFDLALVSLQIFFVIIKLDGVIPLIADPPPANYAALHIRLVCQERNLCLGCTAYLSGPVNLL